ncbi:oligoendopeptidase F [Bacillaceae bacterium JMAK1]|nr:oligoendopeptidase F [Bacillaceae bacterium JMAK1]
MKNFHDMGYSGIDVKEIQNKTYAITERFQNAGSFEEQNGLLSEMNELKKEVTTQETLVSIRHSMDTTDEYYKKEQEKMDQLLPELQEAFQSFSQALVSATYREQLEERWGSQLFALKDLELKTFAPEIVPDLQKENKLSSEYSQLIASAKIEFQGEEYTLAQLAPFEQDTDRSIREAAAVARTTFMADNEAELDRIYDDLIQVRTAAAKKLGFENFIELAYARMSRTDFGPKEVEKFRAQVKEHIVPFASELKEKQRQLIGVDTLMYYDDHFKHPDGNAKPKGDAQFILEQGKTMYDELSEETKVFYRQLLDRDLMDVLSRKGKQSGGYCTFIPNEKVPFVFANFNGTSGDIDVLTHEIGHAFQTYESRELGVEEYQFPTMEAAEIHSFSMEYFAYPWMENFFKEDVDKYFYDHLASKVFALPYMVAVDEFQHRVYEQPELTPAERKAIWRDLERTYMPHINYGDNAYLDGGGLWQRQLHIFVIPFYYIDYGLAQICALQFWKKTNEDREAAWNDYLALCKLGGSKSFVNLVESAGLNVPFKDGVVEDVMQEVKAWFQQ